MKASKKSLLLNFLILSLQTYRQKQTLSFNITILFNLTAKETLLYILVKIYILVSFTILKTMSLKKITKGLLQIIDRNESQWRKYILPPMTLRWQKMIDEN
jgi:hypothetical protein